MAARLPRFDRPRFGLASIVIAAVALAAAVLEGAADGEASQRTFAALVGPLILLAGLHARLDGFVHARARRALLPLPLPSARHWAQAQFDRRLGLGLSLAVGFAAMGAAAATGELHRPWVSLCEFAWLGLFAWILEPLVPAYAAYFGRRFDGETPAGKAQRALGGGWTAPEAVIQLYAPAAGVLGAAALAMPGQLSIERAFEGQAMQTPHYAVAIGPLLLALHLRRSALARYAEGMFEAVPWLEEAERSLSGHGYPRASPSFAKLVRNPWVRLRLVSIWRRVPGAPIRAASQLVVPAYYLGIGAAPSGLGLAAWAGCLLAWVAPIASLHDSGERSRWSRFSQELPLASSGSGALPTAAAAWLLSPVLLALSLLALAWKMHA